MRPTDGRSSSQGRRGPLAPNHHPARRWNRGNYILASLEGRGLDLIEQHRVLWKRVYEFFDAALSIWESVSSDCELLRAHRRLLKELRSLAGDRTQFFSVSDAERLAVAKLE